MDHKARSNKIPYIFFVFFAVIFAVNFLYIYLAQKTWRGIAIEDAYQKGLNYNSALKTVAKQKELGWSINIVYQPNGKNSGLIKVDLKDKNSHPISDAQIYANCRRPTQVGNDFTKGLKFLKNNYQGQFTFPLSGQWDIEVVAIKGSDVFQEVKRLVIQ